MSPRRTAVDSARREPLTRERVLAAALQLIDEEGLDRFSMRRLAARLGVDPMTIYYHLPSKAAVLDGVVEAIMAQFRVPPVTGPIEERWRATARAYRDLLRSHPNVLPIIATWPVQTPVAWDTLEALLAPLLEGGLDGPDALAAVQFMGALINGLVLADVGAPPAGVPDRSSEEKQAAVYGLTPERFPHIATALAQGGVPDFDRTFELAMDVIERGLLSRGRDRPGAGADHHPADHGPHD
jgi:AcrR family transcriptional regulator